MNRYRYLALFLVVFMIFVAVPAVQILERMCTTEE